MELSYRMLQRINERIKIANIPDGFWINEFSDGILDISASFNALKYRNFKIEFTGVTFFNLPASWRTTDIASNEFLIVGHEKSFRNTFREINLNYKLLFDIYLNMPVSIDNTELYGFSIVCDTVDFYDYELGEFYHKTYTDPLGNTIQYPIIKNRVPYL